MNLHTNTATKMGTKTLFIDVIKMNNEDREVFIEQNSPNMQEWQKTPKVTFLAKPSTIHFSTHKH